MVNQVQLRFAEEHNVAIANVTRLVLLANKRARYAEYECNGDHYPGAKDKDACSQAWGEEVAKVDRQILELAKVMRFDDVDFGSGLYPTLVIGGGRTCYIPF